jgi:anti-anti-sigma factor
MAKKVTIFRAEKSRDAVTVHVLGDFTYENTGAFTALVKKLIGENTVALKIKLDLTDCPFVDSGCMGVMAQMHKELKARGGELRIVNVDPVVLEAMRRIRLETIIPVKGKKK